MIGFGITYLGAVGAGLLSFLSPCVLPLVPAYLCFIGGVSLDQLTGEVEVGANGTASIARPARTVSAALAFILGFSVVFVSLGASASAISGILLEQKEILGRVAGAMIVIFGLHFMQLIRIPFLNYEARFHGAKASGGLLGAFLIGLAFAFGWTPCIGPILATILTVAARSDSLAYGTTLLGAYALGLGIPFLMAALAAGPFLRWMSRFRHHIRKVEIATGGLLVATGLLFLSNSFEIISFWLLETFPILGQIG